MKEVIEIISKAIKENVYEKYPLIAAKVINELLERGFIIRKED